MTLSERYLEKLFQYILATPHGIEGKKSICSKKNIITYGLICKYEGALTSTNDDGKRKFFHDELIKIAKENKI